MKDSFEDFYNNSLDNDNLYIEWEKAKKEKNRNIFLSLIIIIGVNIIIGYIFKKGENSLSIDVLIIMVILDIIIYQYINKTIKGKYNRIYKNKIMDKLFKNFFNNVSYKPDQPMPEGIYLYSTTALHDKYYSEDYMEGTIDEKNHIRMADVKTLRRCSKQYKICFNGLFAEIKLDKKIKSMLRISTALQISSDFYIELQQNTKGNLELDSKDFEKFFNVIAKDSVFAHRVLTHDIMEFLVEYRKKIDKEFDIKIDDNYMYIRVYSKEMFEPSINNEVFIDKVRLKREYDIIEFIYILSKKMVEVINEMEI